MAIPTLTEYRAAHGDPARWSADEIDEYLDDCLAALPAPAPFPTPTTTVAATVLPAAA
ncbi:hypothetical protein [Streptomyces sp. NPDC047981]|uniref:hypothetical protein n=1 Tax=Streptomyces sp. NPDC047981 TaxID=3154610 RepID=UPI003445F180